MAGNWAENCDLAVFRGQKSRGSQKPPNSADEQKTVETDRRFWREVSRVGDFLGVRFANSAFYRAKVTVLDPKKDENRQNRQMNSLQVALTPVLQRTKDALGVCVNVALMCRDA